MDEAILRNYWLLTGSLMVISVCITIFIIRWDVIKAWYKSWRSKTFTLVITKNSVRNQVYDVMKELNPSYRKYIRQTVREYLKELQNEPVPRKRKSRKKQILQDD